MISVLFGTTVAFLVSLAGDTKAERLLADYGTKLAKLKSIEIQVEAFRGGEPAGKGSLTMARPAYVRLEKAGRVRILDKKNFSEFFVSKNQYYTRAIRSGELAEVLSDDYFVAWSAFFEEECKALAKMKKTAVYVGQETVEGKKFECVRVTLDPAARKQIELYIDPEDHLAKHVKISSEADGRKAPLLVMSERFEVDAVTNVKAAFAMPKDAKLVPETELIGLRWYYDFDEAMKVAQTTGRLMLVDFYTDWCGWCKRLDRDVFSTQEFADAARNLILVKINAEKGKGVGVARRYNVEGFPTVLFIDKNGKVVHEIGGYLPLEPFLQEMKKAQGGG